LPSLDPDHYQEPVRRLIALIVLTAVVFLGQRTSAQQNLTDSLFGRYLEALRAEAAIPGMSALVLQGGSIVWERHFGLQNVENAIAPRWDTPYAIGGMSQIFGSTLLLKKCIDEGRRQLTDPLTDWIPSFPEPGATLLHLLAHVQMDASYRYDVARFSLLTPVIEACANMPYERLLAEEVFSRLGLVHSVPGTSMSTPTAADQIAFGPNNLQRYAAVLTRMATPYRVDTRGRAIRTELPGTRANAAFGVVTTIFDLARFDATLDHGDEILLRQATQLRAWARPVAHLPAGLGWFVQNYNGHVVIWQYGQIPDAFSSLIVKVPNRRLTFIVLANSDGLSSPFALDNGDVTASLFARLFLRLYVP
jgi:CubicO group peptidase (beta-lactamase class C family)